jgi:ParB/RepB/Spo0J family partition protein
MQTKSEEKVDLSTMAKESIEQKPEVLNIPLNQIRPMKGQPRTHIDMVKLRELADSIAEVGQSQAGKVKPLLEPDNEGHIFELISGERRFRACLMASIGFFRAEIDRSPMTPAQQFVKALTSNSDQEPLSPSENALAIQRLKAMQLNDTEICKVMSRSQVWVSQHYNLLKLSPQVFAMMGPDVPEENRLGFGISLLLVNIPEDYQIALAKDIVARKLSQVQARHLIDSTLRRGGVSVGKKPPGRQFKIFAGFIERTHDQLGALLDTPLPVLRVMLADAPNLQQRMRIIEILGEVAKEAPELKGQVDLILKLPEVELMRQRAATIERLKKMAKGFPKLLENIEKVLREKENVR